MLSGTLIFLSSFIATILLFVFKSKTFANQPYPYFIFGFYVGNLSLLLLFVLDSYFRQLFVWVSRSSELPRQPLAERSMNLSTHCAPIKQP